MPENHIGTELRELVRKRARFNCEYCFALSQYSFHPFAIDHIIPISKEGKPTEENLALSCQHCNSCKYNKIADIDPLTGTRIALFHPRVDIWEEHFIWSRDNTVIVGITTKGRAKVNCLRMNREEAQNLRAALGAFGVHPPQR